MQPTWDWCHACGYDPEGLRPAGWLPGAMASHAPAWASAPVASGSLGPGHASAPRFGYGVAVASPTRTGPAGIHVLGIVALVLVLIVGVCVATVVLLGTSARPRSSAGGPPPTTIPSWGEWRRWTAPDGTFSIDLPGAPTLEEKPSSHADTWTAERTLTLTGPDAMYSVVYSEMRPGVYLDQPARVLEEAVDTMASNGFVPAVRDSSPFAGMPAVRVRGSFVAEQGHAEMLFLLSGGRLYAFVAAAPKATAYDFERFLGSFQIHR